MAAIPGSFNYIQQPSLQYNKPVSEASLAAVGSSINGLLSILMPVGSFIDSMLTEAQFQTEIGNPSPATWVLADGRSAVGTGYGDVTGNMTIPDLRGIMRRAKNDGRSDGKENPDGDLALGTYTASRNAAHSHGVTDPGHIHSVNLGKNGNDSSTNSPPYGSKDGVTGSYNVDSNVTGISIVSQGGGDAAPANITMNTFIRIN